MQTISGKTDGCLDLALRVINQVEKQFHHCQYRYVHYYQKYTAEDCKRLIKLEQSEETQSAAPLSYQ